MQFTNRLLLIICLVSFLSLLSKSLPAQADTIRIVKNNQKLYWYQGKHVEGSQLRNLIKKDPEAFDRLRKGDVFYVGEVALLGASGFVFGYSIGEWLGGGEYDRNKAYISLGLLIATLPFSLLRGSHVRKAVLLFNENRQINSGYTPEVQFGLTSKGVGIRLSF